jgi:hypothetical protein
MTERFGRLDELASSYDAFDREAGRHNAARPGSARAVQLYTDRERVLDTLRDEADRLAISGAATSDEVSEHRRTGK